MEEKKAEGTGTGTEMRSETEPEPGTGTGTEREAGSDAGGSVEQPRPARPTSDDLDAMGDEIAQLAGQIAAAEARFLRLLGSFDQWGGWGGPGIRSIAHWLSWRAGMSLRTAREHVRMARALRDLPQTEAAFGAGELSFSKVRALTRVATRETEESLLGIAKNAPAAHVERLVAGLRKTKKDSDPDDDDEPDPQDDPKPATAPTQRLQWRWDEDTDELVVWGRFGAADGRIVLAALTRAELERIRTTEHEQPETPEQPEEGGRREGQQDGTEGGERERPEEGEVLGTGGDPGGVPADPDAPPADADVPPADADAPPADQDARSADPDASPAEPGARSEAVDRTAPPPSDAGPALVALAQIGLSVQDAPAHAPSAEVIYLHRADGAEEHAEVGAVSADDGPVLDPGTAGEVMCGSSSRCVLRGATGAVLAYGRRRRLFSSTQLRALRLRDRCCQTPGCGRTRFLHAHHVVYWWHGGRTDLDNAVLLCSACHRSVHLGRLAIRDLGGQRFEFLDGESGEVLAPAPPMSGRADEIVAERTIGPRTVTGGWAGEPLDMSLTTSGLLDFWRVQKTLEPRSRGGGWGPTVYDHAMAWDDPSLGTWEPVTAA